MAVFGVRLCLPVLFACVVSTSVVQGRNLRRRHNHHSHPDYYPNFEESMPRDLSRRLEDDLEYQQDSYRRQMELDRPAKYKERILPSRRYKHVYDLRNYAESLRRKDEIGRQEDIIEDASTKYVVRGKRHNRHGGPIYQNINDQERLELEMSRLHKQFELLHHTSTSGGLRASFELEVKEAQNSSICNYTVELIPDNRGTRMPKDLEHVKCNHAGSSCQDTGGYCCIQTYRYIKVSYGNGEEERMKIYVGCVCALQDLNNGLSVVESELPIND
ncbi:uncharacterized protein LOC126848792 [Cataglyphis hispanica]|uniref:uncharacterized protein LOC126848792 n=1 Tax=Cataglyphis hispanica TaxID=1086592 RepID=UPI0021808179|nr:uncharacterized protein LOC126848792 [Cataglyphis hispanica]